ncbi:hypothetical protein V6N13_037432 [Hibiscus sabdariffa]
MNQIEPRNLPETLVLHRNTRSSDDGFPGVRRMIGRRGFTCLDVGISDLLVVPRTDGRKGQKRREKDGHSGRGGACHGRAMRQIGEWHEVLRTRHQGWSSQWLKHRPIYPRSRIRGSQEA